MSDDKDRVSKDAQHIFGALLRGDIYTWVGDNTSLVLSSPQEPLRTHIMLEPGRKTWTVFDVPVYSNDAEPEELASQTWEQVLAKVSEIHGHILAKSPSTLILVPEELAALLGQAHGVTVVDKVAQAFGGEK